MDIVLGVSMAPKTVRFVLVEGRGAGGVTLDEADFGVSPEGSAAAAADQVVAAILGTRESAAESGYQLISSGVTWTDQGQAAALRNALAANKIENVTLVSAIVAAAARAQAVGSATNCARTALLFVEPATATLAVVDSSDGSIVDVHSKARPDGDEAALTELAAMAAGAELAVAAGFALDYFDVRHAETLAPIASVKDGPMRILVAAKLGKTRLIDNVAV